jgi:hypothetical protein
MNDRNSEKLIALFSNGSSFRKRTKRMTIRACMTMPIAKTLMKPNLSARIPPMKGEKIPGAIEANIILLYATLLFEVSTDSAISESIIGIASRETADKTTAGTMKIKVEVKPEIKKRISENSINTVPRTMNGFLCILSESHPKKG